MPAQMTSAAGAGSCATRKRTPDATNVAPTRPRPAALFSGGLLGSQPLKTPDPEAALYPATVASASRITTATTAWAALARKS